MHVADMVPFNGATQCSFAPSPGWVVEVLTQQYGIFGKVELPVNQTDSYGLVRIVLDKKPCKGENIVILGRVAAFPSSGTRAILDHGAPACCTTGGRSGCGAVTVTAAVFPACCNVG